MYATETTTTDTTTTLLNRDEMESRRLEAAQDLLNGVQQAHVARKYGVSRTTASRWYRTLSSQGVDRLHKRKAPGRPSRLTAAQLEEVGEMFQLGAGAFGFDGDRWTTGRLAKAIEGRFGIRYDPDHVGRLMHRLGLRHKPEVAIAAEPVREAYLAPTAFELQI